MKLFTLLLIINSINSGKIMEALKKMPEHGKPPVIRDYTQDTTYSSYLPAPQGLLTKDTYVIGDEPAETLRIDTLWEHFGDVFIVNDGVMIVEDSGRAIIHGNLFVLNQAKLIVTHGTLDFPQEFTYEWSMQVYDSALCEISGGYMRLGNKAFTIGVVQGTVIFDTLTLENGWITGTLFNGASLYANHVNNVGEWIYHDSSTAYISNVDTLLNWFTLDIGDTAFLELASWDSIWHFVAEHDSNGFYGVQYSVHLDTINFCMWGLLIDYGSYVDISNSKIRTIGLYGTSVDTQNISGLVDSTYYSDFTLGFTDRYLHLSNTTVRTWSLYPSNGFYLNFSSSIVGEVLTMENSMAWGEHYYLDGSGGHFQAAENSFNVAFFAAMTSEIYTTENGVALLVVSAIPYSRIWARNSSRLYLIQSQFPEKPVAYDSGLVFILNIDEPTEAPVNEIVPVFGTAEIVEGPLSPIHFDHYSLYWASKEDTTSWYPIAVNIPQKVYRDTLGYWNTTGLAQGEYLYRLAVISTAGDSISMDWGVTLGPSMVKENSSLPTPSLYIGEQSLVLNLPYDINNGTLLVFDISGRVIKEEISGKIRGGTYRFPLPERSGTYIARFLDKDNESSWYVKFQVIK